MAKEKIIKVTKKNVKKGKKTTKKTRKKAEKGDKRLNNEFWKIRKIHGTEKTFKTPEILWKKAVMYFEYVEEHPLIEEKVFVSAGEVLRENVAHLQPMTLKGLFVFLNIGSSTWDLYRDRKDYMVVVERIEDIIYTQKFNGAVAGLMSPAIITRELGLADKKELSGKLTLEDCLKGMDD
jgi:hypothetical protein